MPVEIISETKQQIGQVTVTISFGRVGEKK